MKDHPSRSCTGKQAYLTLKEAEKHQNALRASKGAKMIRAYKCRFCEFFHVGNRKPYQLDWKED